MGVNSTFRIFVKFCANFMKYLGHFVGVVLSLAGDLTGQCGIYDNLANCHLLFAV